LSLYGGDKAFEQYFVMESYDLMGIYKDTDKVMNLGLVCKEESKI
jgi:hypothetical protein